MTGTAIGSAVADLLLGVRLATGGGRRGWTRLLLLAVGTGIGVTVLLLAASVPSVLDAHHGRQFAADYAEAGAVPAGRDVLYLTSVHDEFRGRGITVQYVEPSGPHAPVPPGLSRLPGPGELAASPGVMALLSGGDADLLNRRYPSHGRMLLVDDSGLTEPDDLLLYVGVTGLPHEDAVLGFVPAPDDGTALSPLLWAMLVVGVVVLLAPVVVFVAISARLSGAERDRTLAAVRLVGGSIAGTRRMAAGESLVGAVAGLALGGAGFLLARPLAERQDLVGFAPFAQDVVPSLPLAALVVLGVPALAVATTVLALRRTVIEPLGVTRQAVTTRRRLWWRLLLPVAGVVVLLVLAAGGAAPDGLRPAPPLVLGVVLVLLGVPAVLPWLLDRALRGGWHVTPALQLATGRLRSEGGTPARVVAGLGVVLAGAVGMSAIVGAAGSRYGVRDAEDLPIVTAHPAHGAAAALAGRRADVAAVPGVRAAVVLDRYQLSDPSGSMTDVAVAGCATLRALLDLAECRDGDAFRSAGTTGPPLAGPLRVQTWDADPKAPGVPVRPDTIAALRPVPALSRLATVVMTPGALASLGGLTPEPVLVARFDPAVPSAVDAIRTALAPLQWRAAVLSAMPTALSGDQQNYLGVRRGLLGGTLLALALVAATMVVASVEQVRERRRPLAALAAAGVPRVLLARSMLWQNVVPLLLVVVVADVLGALLGALVLRLVDTPVAVDAGAMAIGSAAAVTAALAATVLTLPAVARATRPSGLRTE